MGLRDSQALPRVLTPAEAPGLRRSRLRPDAVESASLHWPEQVMGSNSKLGGEVSQGGKADVRRGET